MKKFSAEEVRIVSMLIGQGDHEGRTTSLEDQSRDMLESYVELLEGLESIRPLQVIKSLESEASIDDSEHQKK